MADIRGRKELFIITMAIIAAGSLLSAISVNYIMLAASRAIAGFGIGGELGSAITALEEFSPSKNRGFSVGTGNGVMFDFGTFIAGFVSFFAIAYLPVSYGWRIAFLTAVVLAAFIFVARLDLPESIRYIRPKGSKASKTNGPIIPPNLPNPIAVPTPEPLALVGNISPICG